MVDPRPIFLAALSGFLVVVLIGLTAWSAPALAAPVGVEGATLAWLGAVGSLLSLLGVVATAGRGWQKLSDHERRLTQHEACALSTPQRLASMEAAWATRAEIADQRHAELLDRLADLGHRIEDSLGRQHGGPR